MFLLFSGNPDLIHDIFLLATVEMKVTESNTWEGIKRYAAENEVIDSAYG